MSKKKRHPLSSEEREVAREKLRDGRELTGREAAFLMGALSLIQNDEERDSLRERITSLDPHTIEKKEGKLSENFFEGV